MGMTPELEAARGEAQRDAQARALKLANALCDALARTHQLLADRAEPHGPDGARVKYAAGGDGDWQYVELAAQPADPATGQCYTGAYFLRYWATNGRASLRPKRVLLPAWFGRPPAAPRPAGPGRPPADPAAKHDAYAATLAAELQKAAAVRYSIREDALAARRAAAKAAELTAWAGLPGGTVEVEPAGTFRLVLAGLTAERVADVILALRPTLREPRPGPPG